jgi:ribosomal protein S18 acetylase RimI-like enzyme
MDTIQILPLGEEHLLMVKDFTDQWIGLNYYSLAELQTVHTLSLKNNLNSSFVAIDEDQLVGVRLTHAPGVWQSKARGISPDDWQVAADDVAYFKSLFIADSHQGKGLGKILSHYSISVIEEMGGKAIICHSWLESPNNSSQRYLQKMGFQDVNKHEKYWYPIDYECTRCGPTKCVCTAIEMIKYL